MEIVKKLRVRIDALIQSAKTAICSDETLLAYRELQLAKAWLGKSLEYLILNSDAAAILYAGGLPLNKSFVPFELPNQPVKKFSVMDALIGESVSIKGAVVANCPIERQQKEYFDECVKCLLRAEFWYREEIVRIRDTPMNVPAHLSQQPLAIDEVKMDAITSAPVLEPPTKDEQAEANAAFGTKLTGLNDSMVYDFSDGMDVKGDTEYEEVSTSKISENEDKNHQEKQPRASKKKK